MNKSSILFFVVLLAFFGCDKIGTEEIMRAEVNGESWKANRIITNTNDVGEVIYIEGIAADNSRMLFTLLDSEINSLPSDFPVDAEGNSMASNIHLSIVPDLVRIRFHLEVLASLPTVERIIIEQSTDGETFTGFHQINFDGRSSFTETWVATNDRASNNNDVFYRYKLIYDTNTVWNSNIQIGLTSFRGSYDSGLTESENTGDFTVTQYEQSNKRISGEFSFVTDNNQIVNGAIIDVDF